MASDPLALLGPYGPHVLNCGSLLTRSHASTIDPAELNSYRLLVIDDGSLRFDEPDGRAECLPPGAACLLVPATSGAVRIAPHSTVRFVVFDAIHHPRRGSAGRLLHCPPLRPQPDPERIWGLRIPRRLPPLASAAAYELCGLIRGEYWRGVAEHLRAGARLGLWLADLVIELRDHVDQTVSVDPFVAAEHHARRLAPHLPSVAELAAWCGMSRGHFSRAFKRERGVSPSVFLDRERWQVALRLLIDTEDAVAQIARNLGYRQVSAFSRAFRRRVGCSPRSYRQQHRRGRH